MRPAWYTASYCEENVWRLIQEPTLDVERRHAVFISNAQRACPVWRQRTAPAPGEPVLWDYHVVLLGHAAGAWLVFDLDSELPFPVGALEYLQASFPRQAGLDPQWQPQFRVVEGDTLVRTFASDRSHMRRAEGGWTSPPPPFECIRTATETMNLWQFVDMKAAFAGRVLSLMELVWWLAEGDAK